MIGSRSRELLATLCFLVVLACLPFWRCIAYGEVFVPAKMLAGFEPWFSTREAQASREAWDILRWDSVAQFYPWRKYLFESLREGQIPLWNRRQLLGTPFLANSQSAVFYPLHWVLVPLGPDSGITIAALFHLVWCGLGVYVLCRRLGCRWGPAVFAAVTFQMSQWVIGWLQISSVPSTVSWFPWLLAGVHSAVAGADRRAAAWLAICTAMMLLAGHLQIAAYGMFAALCFATGLLIAKRGKVLAANDVANSSKASEYLAASFVLATLVAAVHLLPVIEMGRLSHRSAPPTADGYSSYVRLAMPLSMLGLLTDPYHAGDPRLGVSTPGEPADGAYHGSEPLPEYSAYVGFAALVFATYSVLRIRTLGAAGVTLALLLLVSYAIALGTDLNRVAYFLIPGWSSTGSPARILCLAALGFAVLGGLGLNRMLEDAEQLGSDRRIRLGSCLLLTITLITGTMLLLKIAHPAARWLVPSLTFAITLPAICLSSNPTHRTLGCALAIVAQIVQLAPFACSFNTTAQAHELYPRFDELKYLRAAAPYRVAVLNEDYWNRYVYPHATLPPNSALALGFDDVSGYDSLILRTTKERLLDELNMRDSAVRANGNMLIVRPSALQSGLLEEMSVRYVVAASVANSQEYRQVGHKGGLVIVRLRPKPLCESNGVPGNLEWQSPNAFVVRLPTHGDSPILARIAAAPGWKVESEGSREELRIGSAPPGFLAAYVPEGTKADATNFSETVWKYEPSSYTVGFFLTLTGLSALSGLIASNRVKSRFSNKS